MVDLYNKVMYGWIYKSPFRDRRSQESFLVVFILQFGHVCRLVNISDAFLDDRNRRQSGGHSS